MSEQSILVVEDTLEMQMFLRAILSPKYFTKIVATAREAYEEIRRHKFDLLLVDVDLPDESGFQFCANVKLDSRYAQVPLVFLTSHDQTANVVVGFSLGAEDYIVKPVVREQFEARIAAKLRNRQSEKQRENIFRHGQFVLDLLQQRAFVKTETDQIEVPMTSIEFRLFKYFLDHIDHVLSREQILNHVWGQNLNVTDRTVDTHVYSLRKKLGVNGKCIRTVSGVGYQLKSSELKQVA